MFRSSQLLVIALLPCLFPSPAADVNAECLNSLVKNLSSCTERGEGHFGTSPVIRANMGRLIFLCSAENATTKPPVLQILSAKVYSTTMMIGQTAALLAGADMSVNFTSVPVIDWIQAPEADMLAAQARGNGATAHHAWLLNSDVAGRMVELDALQDLSQLVASERSLEWSDVHPYYRTVSANYGGQVLMLPVDGAMWVMYVRHDVLAAHGLAMPATWEDVIHAAAIVHGTDMNGDGTNDTAICFASCLVPYMINSIFASIVQTHGYQQGWYYDTLTMQLMANTTGFAYALQLYQRMYAYGVPSTSKASGFSFNLGKFLSEDCLTHQPLFADGACAFTFGWSVQFKRNSYDGSCVPGARFPGSSCAGVNAPRYARGRTTAAPLPGSRLVFDRAAQTLKPCTLELCPYSAAMTGLDGVTALVNTAPYSAFGGVAGAINKFSSGAYQFSAYSFLSLFCEPGLSTFNLLDPLTEIGPFRLSQLDESLMQATYNISWTSAGYEASDVESFLRTTNAALIHPNLAMDCRISTAVTYGTVTSFVAIAVTVIGTPLATIMKQLSALLRPIVPTTQEALADQQRKYWMSLNFVLAPPPAPDELRGLPGAQPPQPPLPTALTASLGQAFLQQPQVAGPVLAASGLTILLLVSALVYGVSLQRLRHKSLWGRVLAPKAGPATTLLVTDIEGSTTLWETFDDAHVMDTALRLHHSVVRRLLVAHSGYETATEGDSFIVAFHSADKALQFALDVQLTLLRAAWPTELDSAPASRRLWSVQARGAVCEERGTPKGPTVRSCSGGKTSSNTTPQLQGSVRPAARKTNASGGSSMSFIAFPGASNVRAALAALHPTSEDSGSHSAEAALLHRGLRVRVGMHTGVLNPSEVAVNAASGRTTFSGEPIVIAKAVADAAHGGQVLCSETSHADLWKRCSGQPYASLACMIWHAGLHELQEGLPPLHLYSAFPRTLLPRVALFPPLRSLAERLPGVLEVPLGLLAVSVATISGAATLLEWDQKEATHAVSVFQACCAAAADHCGGFVTELGAGEIVGVFSSCSAAVAWSLHVIQAMKQFGWSETLLSHPLCEDLSIFGEPSAAAAASATPLKGSSKQRRQLTGLKPAPREQPPRSPLQEHRQRAGKLNTGFTAVFHPTLSGQQSGGFSTGGDPVHGRSTLSSDGGSSSWAPSEAASAAQVLLFHGPRVRAGVVVGDMAVDIPHSSATGRPTLRGHAITLATRIAETALSSQVLCTAEVCDGVDNHDAVTRSSPQGEQDTVMCTLSGRGVRLPHQEKTDVYVCRFRSDVGGMDSDLSRPTSSSQLQGQVEQAASGSVHWPLASLGGWEPASMSGVGVDSISAGGGLRKAISLSSAKATLASLIGRATQRAHVVGAGLPPPALRVRHGSAPGIAEAAVGGEVMGLVSS